MIKTNYDFIHEYDAYDDVVDCLESAKHEIAVAFYEYERISHQAEMSAIFEGTDKSEKTANASKNIFEKIGNKIISIIHSVSEFIKKVLDKILGDTPLVKSDSEKISEMIKEHPELQKKIVDGIDKGWFTQKDVAKYHKNVVGLIQMLEKNAIDHATFMDKMKKFGNDFSKSAKTITTITGAAGTLLALGPAILKGVKGVKTELANFIAEIEIIKKRITHNYTENDMSKAQAIMNAIGESIGLINAEANDRAKGHKSLMAFFKSFLNKNTTRDSLKDEEKKRNDEEIAKQAADEEHEANVKNAAKAKQDREDYDEDEVRTQAGHEAHVSNVRSKEQGRVNRDEYDKDEYMKNLTHKQQMELDKKEHKEQNPDLYPDDDDDANNNNNNRRNNNFNRNNGRSRNNNSNRNNGKPVHLPNNWDHMNFNDKKKYLKARGFEDSYANKYANKSRSNLINSNNKFVRSRGGNNVTFEYVNFE